MPNFFCKLNAPRPSFLADITPDEMKVMQDHGAYWREWLAKGNVIAFGVVADPAGAFGVGLVEFENEGAVRSFTDNDPTIQSGRGFRWDISPMPMGVVR